MKRMILIMVMVMMAGCAFRYEHEPCHDCGPLHDETAYIQTTIALDHYEYSPGCYDEPYYHSPEWCDDYGDRSTCCVWYVDGWFEEYCQWGNDWCWEYNGSW